MSKFHISKNGVPAPCKATKGNCPLGGNSGDENHFDSKEEAQQHADKENSSKYGTLPEIEEAKAPREPINFPSLTKEDKVKALELINEARGKVFPNRLKPIEEVDMSKYGSHVTTPNDMLFPEDAGRISDVANATQSEYEFTARRGERGGGFVIKKL